jgi:hypothetical protein
MKAFKYLAVYALSFLLPVTLNLTLTDFYEKSVGNGLLLTAICCIIPALCVWGIWKVPPTKKNGIYYIPVVFALVASAMSFFGA